VNTPLKNPSLPADLSSHPRVLEINLETREVSLGVFASAWPELERVAAWSGSALAWALQADANRSGSAPPFVLAVGEAVRRGVPTAARLSVCGLGAHTGRIAEGSVGGSLGRRLASVADALVLRGQASEPGQVLVVEASGAVRWRAETGGETLSAVLKDLELAHPDAGRLAVGPAAMRGVSYANLAVGEDPPSFVGRGGLGSTLAAMGVMAVVVEAPEITPELEVADWTALLQASPRLRERGAGGSLERAFEASLGDMDSVEDEAARALASEGVSKGVSLRGCAGCPTPCGWVFESPAGERGAARFNALDSLGGALGLVDPAETRQVLAACDQAGVDAKEAGAAMAVMARARAQGLCEEGPRLGEVVDFTEALEELALGAGPGWALADGAQVLAVRFGQETPMAQGEAMRPRHGLGGALAAAVAARGAEPMRTFAFLLEGGVPRERAQKLLAPLELTRRSLDPSDSAEKGRLVWWHENFVAGLDSTGFCAFSAAGVLADGVMELGELAVRLLGEGASAAPADELLARGASLCLLARELTGSLESPPEAKLSEPWAEYRALRGLDAMGAVCPEVAASIGTHDVLRWQMALATDGLPEERAAGAGGRGTIFFSGSGGIRRALGGSVKVSVDLPMTLRDALVVLSKQRVGVKDMLFVKEEAIVTAWRDGERVDLDSQLWDGDQLDLILAVGGG
jgi:aldehyde:ferredoxin oxidoreductase